LSAESVSDRLAWGSFTDYEFYTGDIPSGRGAAQCSVSNEDLSFALSSVTSNNAELRITILYIEPNTPTTLDGSLTVGFNGIYRQLDTLYVRVSWGNDLGTNPYVNSSSTVPPQWAAQGATVGYTLSSVASVSNDFFGFIDSSVVYILLIALMAFVMVLGFASSIIRQRRMAFERHLREQREGISLRIILADPPKMFKMLLDISRSDGATGASLDEIRSVGDSDYARTSQGSSSIKKIKSESAQSLKPSLASSKYKASLMSSLKTKKSRMVDDERYVPCLTQPLTVEKFSTSIPPLFTRPTDMLAVTYPILLPGAEMRMATGDVPQLAFGTVLYKKPGERDSVRRISFLSSSDGSSSLKPMATGWFSGTIERFRSLFRR
jgi:hypothetical protein